MDRVPAANWNSPVRSGGGGQRHLSRYSSVDVWNVDSWVSKLFPQLTEICGQFPRGESRTGRQCGRSEPRVRWGGRGKILRTSRPAICLPPCLYDLVEEAYGWLADNAEELFLPDDETVSTVRGMGVNRSLIFSARCGQGHVRTGKFAIRFPGGMGLGNLNVRRTRRKCMRKQVRRKTYNPGIFNWWGRRCSNWLD